MKLFIFSFISMFILLTLTSCQTKASSSHEDHAGMSGSMAMMSNHTMEMCLPMSGYFDGVKALANDDFPGAQKAFKKFESDMKNSTNGEAKEHQAVVAKVLTPVTAASDIKTMRNNLVALSKVVIECNEDCGMSEGVYTYQCPMKNATWMSTSSTVENPYYGKEMRDCGERVKAEKKK